MNHPPRKAPRMNCLECKLCGIPITRHESHEHMYIEHKMTNACAFCDYKAENCELSHMSIKDIVDQNDTSLTVFERFKRHIDRSHRFKEPFTKCNYCNKNLESPELLKQHKDKKVDLSTRQVPLCLKLPKGCGKTICNLCGKTVMNNSLHRHQAKVHDVNRDIVFKFKCSYCPKTYCAARALTTHLLHHHLPMSEPDSTCKICGKSYGTKDSLRRHLILHEKPSIKCPQCDKLFKWKNNVLQHLKGS